MNEQDTLIEEQKKKLPPELLGAIEATPWKNLVQEIGRANGLNADQLATLEQETILIIYDFVNPIEYSSNLVKELGIDETKAMDISDSVWEKIMEPVSQKVVVTANPSQNLPMVEKGEVAHTVDSKQYIVDSKPAQPKTTPPDYRYPDGKDPYHEPLK